MTACAWESNDIVFEMFMLSYRYTIGEDPLIIFNNLWLIWLKVSFFFSYWREHIFLLTMPSIHFPASSCVGVKKIGHTSVLFWVNPIQNHRPYMDLVMRAKPVVSNGYLVHKSSHILVWKNRYCSYISVVLNKRLGYEVSDLSFTSYRDG